MERATGDERASRARLIGLADGLSSSLRLGRVPGLEIGIDLICEEVDLDG